MCQCKNSWGGATCETCPSLFGQDDDCNSCAETGTYPVCGECSTAMHCNERAENVTDVNGQCVCSCDGQWEGKTCQTCPQKFGGANCDECSAGTHRLPQLLHMHCRNTLQRKRRLCYVHRCQDRVLVLVQEPVDR